MRSQINTTNDRVDSLVYLLVLTGFFILLEISFFIQNNSSYFSVVNEISKNLAIPSAIYPEIFIFILIQLLLPIFYSFSIYIVTNSIRKKSNVISVYPQAFAISVWLIGMLAILLANQIYFPNSKYADLTAFIFFNSTFAFFIYHMCLGILTFLLLLFFMIHIKIFLSILVFLFAGFFYIEHANKDSAPFLAVEHAAAQKPNVFIIGVDSLRPDFLHYFGHAISTPFIDSFLKESIIFTEAITPLARTYPSWMSILTGQHPKTINVRSNLAPSKNMHIESALESILKNNGYTTIYATDETRFSNIDKHYGFDHVYTSKIGLNDFLLGTFNDFPLSNLIVNTAVGKFLFPYSYGNRAVYTTYDPNSFINIIKPIFKNSSSKPLFMAIHFCLPHYPYLWNDLNSKLNNYLQRYEAAISRADKQLEDFVILLQQHGFLNNAIVILLSDHGEALELQGDRVTERELFRNSTQQQEPPIFYPPSLEHERFNESAGHGTDVLGLPQYHTLLAFRAYGRSQLKPGLISGVVSLTRIKSTVLQLLSIPDIDNGNSLVDIMQRKKFVKPSHLFIESDFSPSAIRSVYPNVKAAMLEGATLFQIDLTTTRLTVKPDMLAMIINSKQYADIYGEWMLALYPKIDRTYFYILINLRTGVWTDDLSSTFALSSPANNMLIALKSFYSKELRAEVDARA